MKRDMDLVRLILIELEKRTLEESGSYIEIPGYDKGTITYHLKLLHQAGLITASDTSDNFNIDIIPDSLTWDGHDFLELAKNETTWKKAIQFIKDKGGSLTYEIIKQVLSRVSSDFIGQFIKPT